MGESSSSGKTAMTWDDALSINALTSYLRRVNPAHLPLLEFCVDCSAFLKRGNSGSEAERPGFDRATLHDTYFRRESERTCLLDLIKVKPEVEGEATNTFLQEAQLEAEHLLAINHFQHFLSSAEYKSYVLRLEELKQSAEGLDNTSQKLNARPKWAPDSAKCNKCHTAFNGSIKRRRHHCRACGLCVCEKCSPATNLKPIPAFGYFRPVRHCNDCMVNWQLDSDAIACAVCANKFTLINRRHHCRNCGKVVCSDCSPKQNFSAIPQLGWSTKVRICMRCTTNSPKLNYKLARGRSASGPLPVPAGGGQGALSRAKEGRLSSSGGAVRPGAAAKARAGAGGKGGRSSEGGKKEGEAAGGSRRKQPSARRSAQF